MSETTTTRCRSWHKDGPFGRRRRCFKERGHTGLHRDVMNNAWGVAEEVETGAKIIDLMEALKASLGKTEGCP